MIFGFGKDNKKTYSEFFTSEFRIHFEFITDTATLAVYDPTLVNKYKNENDWWIDYDNVGNTARRIPEIDNGQIALVNIESDGIYSILIKNHPFITDENREEMSETILWEKKNMFSVESVSGKVCIGAAESLPGYGGEFVEPWILECGYSWGVLLDLPKGRYDIDVYLVEGINVEVESPDPESRECAINLVLVLKPVDEIAN